MPLLGVRCPMSVLLHSVKILDLFFFFITGLVYTQSFFLLYKYCARTARSCYTHLRYLNDLIPDPQIKRK